MEAKAEAGEGMCRGCRRVGSGGRKEPPKGPEGRKVGSFRIEELSFQQRLADLLEASEGRTARPAVSRRRK
jgi:hypothetical protein